MVQISIDAKQLERVQRTLNAIKSGAERAVAPAINRALNHGRTVIRREIRKQYVIKQKDIPIRVSGANPTRLSGSITLEQGMLDLSKFKVRPRSVQRRKRKRPIYAQVRIGGGGYIRSAFMTSFGGPFMRKGAASLPIKKLLAIGAPIMAAQPAVGEAASKGMGETLDKRLDHEIQRVLTRAQRTT